MNVLEKREDQTSHQGLRTIKLWLDWIAGEWWRNLLCDYPTTVALMPFCLVFSCLGVSHDHASRDNKFFYFFHQISRQGTCGVGQAVCRVKLNPL